MQMKEISVQELKELMDKNSEFQLIDVRELHEYETGNIGGLHIPLSQILDNIEKLSKDKMVVIHCRSGMRSATAIDALEAHHQYANLYNLKGGILAYAREVDSSIMV
jgi:adenylyltransferase/sulfurtransferase